MYTTSIFYATFMIRKIFNKINLEKNKEVSLVLFCNNSLQKLGDNFLLQEVKSILLLITLLVIINFNSIKIVFNFSMVVAKTLTKNSLST